MTESKQQHIFETWLDEHKALLFKVIRAYAFTETDRDDLFQEIAIQVWRSVPNFKSESTVTTWVYRVSLNTAIKWNRDEQKHRQGQESFENMEHLLQQNQEKIDERLEWMYRQIAKLNKIDRSLCLLLLDGFSYQEMSGILGISESNVGVKIHRIKKHLIEKSEEYDHAIASVNYEVKRSKTMVWWFIVPLAIPVLLNMVQESISWWKVLGILGAFVFSYLLVRWEFNRCHLPKKQKLEALRTRLTEDVDAERLGS